MSFDREKLFDVKSTDEELKQQLRDYFMEGGKGNWLVYMIIQTPMPGIASHTDRLMTLLEELSIELEDAMRGL